MRAHSGSSSPDEGGLTRGPLTALRERPRAPGRVSVEIGGREVGPVSVEALASLGLTMGQMIEGELLERLAEHIRRAACHDRALAALARRSRSSKELARWLKQRGFAPENISVTLERLTDLGLLDDLQFARSFVLTRSRERGLGRRRLQAELGRRGVESGIIATVMFELISEQGSDERDAIRAAATRRLGTLSGLEPVVARRRLLGWLVRRGFGIGESAEVVRGLIGGAPRGSDSPNR